MVASATVTVNGETVYPYEPGKLEYYRTTDLKSTVNGTVLSNKLVNYLQVSAGQVPVSYTHLEVIPGVGPRIAGVMEHLGIRQVADLRLSLIHIWHENRANRNGSLCGCGAFEDGGC